MNFIKNWSNLIENKLKLIENKLKLIENGQKIRLILTFFDWVCHFRSFNWHFQSFEIIRKWPKKIENWLNYRWFNQKMVEINRILSLLFNGSWSSSADFESDRFRCLNSDGLKSQLSTIQFVGPNGLSLVLYVIFFNVPLQFQYRVLMILRKCNYHNPKCDNLIQWFFL